MGGLRGNRVAVLVTVCLGFFMVVVDLSIVNVAIPDIITGLDASVAEVVWVINSYTLVIAALVITSGRLGDLVGQRGMFTVGVAVFTATSVACGLAGSPQMLIAFRAAQGLGAAMLLPQTLALLTKGFPADKRGVAFGIWSAVIGLGFITGPIIGGALVDAGGWRWIFLINLPVGIAVVGLAAVTLPGGVTAGRLRLDLTGMALASAALLCVCYGLIEGQRHDWGHIVGPLSIPLVLAAGVVLFIVFAWQQHRRQGKDPLIPSTLLSDRNFGLMSLIVAALGIALMGLMLPSMLYVQQILGLSPLGAGLTLLPSAATSVVASLAVGRFADRAGARWLIVVGLVVGACGLVWMGWAAEPNGPWTTLLPGIMLTGFGAGMAQTPIMTIAMRGVPDHIAGAASAVLNTMRQLGTALGAAAVGALLQNRLVDALTEQARDRSAALPSAAREAFVDRMAELASNLGGGAGADGPAAIPGVSEPDVAGAVDAVVRHGFVDAFTTTLVLPAVVVIAAALAGLAVRPHSRPGQPQVSPEPTAD